MTTTITHVLKRVLNMRPFGKDMSSPVFEHREWVLVSTLGPNACVVINRRTKQLLTINYLTRRFGVIVGSMLSADFETIGEAFEFKMKNPYISVIQEIWK